MYFRANSLLIVRKKIQARLLWKKHPIMLLPLIMQETMGCKKLMKKCFGDALYKNERFCMIMLFLHNDKADFIKHLSLNKESQISCNSEQGINCTKPSD